MDDLEVVVIFVCSAEDEMFSEGISFRIPQLTQSDKMFEDCGDSDLESCWIQSCTGSDCEGARSAGIDDDEVKISHRGQGTASASGLPKQQF